MTHNPHSHLRTHCRRGHEFTPENTSIEFNDAGEKVRRCRTCRLNQKRLRYRNDERFRNERLAYAHWFKCGHPEGKAWPEIRAELAMEATP